ncbi:MAG: cytochrome c oxidase subunit 3 [Chlamydiae bacterium]|nr:cytochrome c oxidase subunit 3 [Chlamydiota bacterium]
MKDVNIILSETYPDPHHDMYSRTIFGFWIFLLTDFILFGVLFATFAVLVNSTFGGPGALDLFNIHSAFLQTLLLLCASFTVGIAGAAAHRKNKKLAVLFFWMTFVLGSGFLLLEFADFNRLIASGNGWERSAFLSMFFTVVGTHALHVIFALLWIPVLLFSSRKEPLTQESIRRFTCLKMFWQFLNIVWVFIFAFVYFAHRG